MLNYLHAHVPLPELPEQIVSLAQAQIDGHSLDPKCLLGRYIPNLTAQPFELSKEYFELVHRATGSVALEGVLREVIFVLLCIAEGMVANHDLVGYIS